MIVSIGVVLITPAGFYVFHFTLFLCGRFMVGNEETVTFNSVYPFFYSSIFQEPTK